jgi:hypothetical protein
MEKKFKVKSWKLLFTFSLLTSDFGPCLRDSVVRACSVFSVPSGDDAEGFQMCAR